MRITNVTFDSPSGYYTAPCNVVATVYYSASDVPKQVQCSSGEYSGAADVSLEIRCQHGRQSVTNFASTGFVTVLLTIDYGVVSIPFTITAVAETASIPVPADFALLAPWNCIGLPADSTYSSAYRVNSRSSITIAGNVIDSNTGIALTGRQINLLGRAPISTTTDQNGNYSFTILIVDDSNGGTYKYTVSPSLNSSLSEFATPSQYTNLSATKTNCDFVISSGTHIDWTVPSNYIRTDNASPLYIQVENIVTSGSFNSIQFFYKLYANGVQSPEAALYPAFEYGNVPSNYMFDTGDVQGTILLYTKININGIESSQEAAAKPIFVYDRATALPTTRRTPAVTRLDHIPSVQEQANYLARNRYDLSTIISEVPPWDTGGTKFPSANWTPMGGRLELFRSGEKVVFARSTNNGTTIQDVLVDFDPDSHGHLNEILSSTMSFACRTVHIDIPHEFPTYIADSARISPDFELAFDGFSIPPIKKSVANYAMKVYTTLGSYRINSMSLWQRKSGATQWTPVTNFDQTQSSFTLSIREAGTYSFRIVCVEEDEQETTKEFSNVLVVANPDPISARLRFINSNTHTDQSVWRLKKTDRVAGWPQIDIFNYCTCTSGVPERYDWYIDGVLVASDVVTTRSQNYVDPISGQRISEANSTFKFGYSQPKTFTVKCIVRDVVGRLQSVEQKISFDYDRPINNCQIVNATTHAALASGTYYEPLQVELRPMNDSYELVNEGAYLLDSVEVFTSPDPNATSGTAITSINAGAVINLLSGNHNIFVKASDQNRDFNDPDLLYRLGTFTVISLPPAQIDLSFDPESPHGAKRAYVKNESVTISCKVTSNTPLDKFDELEYRITFPDGQISTATYSSIQSYTLDFTQAGRYYVQGMATDALKRKTLTPVYTVNVYNGMESKKYKVYVTIDPEQRAALEGNDTKELVLDLYRTFSESNSNSSLYFAPRTWPEAGRIVEVLAPTTVTKNGLTIDVLPIVVEKRLGTVSSGMEAFKYADLPINPADGPIYDTKDTLEDKSVKRPRGVVFATARKDSAQAIRLSTADDFTFTDTKSNATITKEGFRKHPIILYAQNNRTPSLNAFGSCAPSRNVNFYQYPFQPWLTILNKEEYTQTATQEYKFFCLCYSSVSKTAKFDYNIEHVYSIRPFDETSLKIRQNQYVAPADANPIADNSVWGKGDVPSDCETLPSWKYTGQTHGGRTVSDTQLTFSETGSLFLRATSGPEQSASFSYFGQPHTSGVWGNAERYMRTAVLESNDNLYSSSDTSGLNHTANSIQFLFGVGNALVGVNTTLSTTPLSFNSPSVKLVTSLSKDGRYYAFANGHRIYIWDQYLSKETGPFIPIKGSNEDVCNLSQAGEAIMFLANSGVIQLDSGSRSIKNLPFSTKYFKEAIFLFNMDYNNPTKNWIVSSGILNRDKSAVVGIDLDATPRYVRASTFDNYVYFTTKTSVGIGVLGGQTFFYKIDPETGSLAENSYSDPTAPTWNENTNSSYKIEGIQSTDLSIPLLNDNQKQTVVVGGYYGQLPFQLFENIVLADRVKPTIFGGKGRILTSDCQFKNAAELKFVTTGWTPDKIMVCGSQLLNSASYSKAFADDDTPGETNATVRNIGGQSYEITVLCDLQEKFWKKTINSDPQNPSNFYIAGSHYVTLGLENWPFGSKNSELGNFRANYQQNSAESLQNNFSTIVTIVNREDYAIEIENAVGPKRIVTDDFLQVTLSARAYVVSASKNIVDLRTSQQLLPMQVVVINNDGNTEIRGVNLNTILPSNPYDETVLGSAKDRFAGCTMCDVNGNRYTILSNDSTAPNTNNAYCLITTIVLAGNVASRVAGKKLAISPFIPTHMSAVSTLGNTEKRELKIKEFRDSRVNYYPQKTSIKRVVGNDVSLYFTDEKDDVSITYDANVSFAGTGTVGETGTPSGAAYVEFGFFEIYDEATKVFARPLATGARGIRSNFFHLNDRRMSLSGGSLVHMKIHSSVQLVTDDDSKPFIVRLYTSDENGLEHDVLTSPFSSHTSETAANRIWSVVTDQNAKDYNRVFRVSIAADSSLMSKPFTNIHIELTAYDTDGNIIKIK